MEEELVLKCTIRVSLLPLQKIYLLQSDGNAFIAQFSSSFLEIFPIFGRSFSIFSTDCGFVHKSSILSRLQPESNGLFKSIQYIIEGKRMKLSRNWKMLRLFRNNLI